MGRGILAALACLLALWTLEDRPAAAETAAVRSSETATDQAVALDVIIVTGTKREASSQSIPISVSALSGQMISNTFRSDITAVSDLAPNVVLSQLPGFRAIAGGIRGTGQNSILVTQDSSVVVLVDEFGLSRVQSQFVPLFDVERVEIFRGPQGTLFGKSATGGAISIVTKRPEFNEFSGQIEVQLGRFDAGAKGMIGKVQTALNVPVVQDKFAIRLTGLYDYDQGYYRNNKPASSFPEFLPIYADLGVPTPLPDTFEKQKVGSGERLGGTDVFAGSFKALFTPTDAYEAYFIFRLLRDRSDSPPVVNESASLGEIDPALEAGFIANGVDPAEAAAAAQQFMLVPLLGFDGINTPGAGGPDPPWSTGASNSCWHPRAFCIPRGHTVDVEEYHLHQTLSLDSVSMQLLAGYRSHREILPSSYSGEAQRALAEATRNAREKQFQLEWRLSTHFEGPLNFIAGASYQSQDLGLTTFGSSGLFELVLFLPGGMFNEDGDLNLRNATLNGDFFSAWADHDRKTYAVYLDGTWDVSRRLKLSAGLRYTYDKKHFLRSVQGGGQCTIGTAEDDIVFIDDQCVDLRANAISRAIAQGFDFDALGPFDRPLPEIAFSAILPTQGSWDKVTWRMVADYQVAKEALIYLSYATGFIPGGFTETCGNEESCRAFRSETNWNLEAGLKSDWFERTLRLNLAVFYTRYSDLVRTQNIRFINRLGLPASAILNINAGKSEVFGVEFEASWVPIQRLRLDLAFGYMDHDYVDFVLPGTDFGGIENADLSSLTVPYSPKWNVRGSMTYDMALGNKGHLIWNTNVQYQSETETTVFNGLYSQMQKRTLWDGSVTWRDNAERYRLTLFVKNLLNETYRAAGNSVAGLWNFSVYGRPREFGAEFGIYF